MMIGERLRVLREQKKLSQGDIEERTGLLRAYVSRVENGHTVPTIATLEKIVRALDMEVYQLMYDGDEPPQVQTVQARNQWGGRGKNARYLSKLSGCLSRMEEKDRELLLGFVQRVAKRY